MTPQTATKTWRDRARCIDADPDVFYPPGESYLPWAVRDALECCSRCLVRSECLEEALELADDHGIQGGKTPAERRRIRERRRKRRARKVGAL